MVHVVTLLYAGMIEPEIAPWVNIRIGKSPPSWIKRDVVQLAPTIHVTKRSLGCVHDIIDGC